MRKLSMPILLVILFMLGYGIVSAQTDYLVLTKGDTLYGKVTHLNYGKDQKVQLIDSEDKKIVYSMLQVKSFQTKKELFHLIKMYEQYAYMKPESSGYLSLYSFQRENQVTWDGRFLHKRDGQGIEVPNLGFKKKMASFISECPELSEEVNAGTLSRKDLDEIISKFNACIDKRTSTVNNTPPLTQISTEELDAWNMLESAVRVTENLESKESILEMIAEVHSKTKRGEKIPNFIIDGLKKSLDQQNHLLELLNKALNEKQ